MHCAHPKLVAGNWTLRCSTCNTLWELDQRDGRTREKQFTRFTPNARDAEILKQLGYASSKVTAELGKIATKPTATKPRRKISAKGLRAITAGIRRYHREQKALKRAAARRKMNGHSRDASVSA